MLQSRCWREEVLSAAALRRKGMVSDCLESVLSHFAPTSLAAEGGLAASPPPRRRRARLTTPTISLHSPGRRTRCLKVHVTRFFCVSGSRARLLARRANAEVSVVFSCWVPFSRRRRLMAAGFFFFVCFVFPADSSRFRTEPVGCSGAGRQS